MTTDTPGKRYSAVRIGAIAKAITNTGSAPSDVSLDGAAAQAGTCLPGYEGPGVMRRQGPLWPNHVGRGPRNYRRTDERIHEDVCERLTDDPRVDAFDIEVRVKDGEVTLAGNVTSREQKRRAEDVAALVTGVRDVVNELRVALL